MATRGTRMGAEGDLSNANIDRALDLGIHYLGGGVELQWVWPTSSRSSLNLSDLATRIGKCHAKGLGVVPGVFGAQPWTGPAAGHYYADTTGHLAEWVWFVLQVAALLDPARDLLSIFNEPSNVNFNAGGQSAAVVAKAYCDAAAAVKIAYPTLGIIAFNLHAVGDVNSGTDPTRPNSMPYYFDALFAGDGRIATTAKPKYIGVHPYGWAGGVTGLNNPSDLSHGWNGHRQVKDLDARLVAHGITGMTYAITEHGEPSKPNSPYGEDWQSYHAGLDHAEIDALADAGGRKLYAPVQMRYTMIDDPPSGNTENSKGMYRTDGTLKGLGWIVAARAAQNLAGDPPSPPRSLAAVTGTATGTVKLTWLAPTTSGNPVTAYKLERSLDNGATWGAPTTLGNVLTTTDTPGANVRATYRVTAVSSDGTSSPSNRATATGKDAVIVVPPPPSPRTHLPTLAGHWGVTIRAVDLTAIDYLDGLGAGWVRIITSNDTDHDALAWFIATAKRRSIRTLVTATPGTWTDHDAELDAYRSVASARPDALEIGYRPNDPTWNDALAADAHHDYATATAQLALAVAGVVGQGRHAPRLLTASMAPVAATDPGDRIPHRAIGRVAAQYGPRLSEARVGCAAIATYTAGSPTDATLDPAGNPTYHLTAMRRAMRTGGWPTALWITEVGRPALTGESTATSDAAVATWLGYYLFAIAALRTAGIPITRVFWDRLRDDQTGTGGLYKLDGTVRTAVATFTSVMDDPWSI